MIVIDLIPRFTMEKFRVFSIPIENILVQLNWNSREDYGEIEELANSILENGLVTPLTVRKTTAKEITETGKSFFLIDGFRRFQAIGTLKTITDVPCQIESDELSEGEQVFQQFVRNDYKEFNSIERALLLLRVSQLNNWDAKKLIVKTGLKQAQVYRLLSVKKWPVELQDACKENKISFASAYDLFSNCEGRKRVVLEQLDRLLHPENYVDQDVSETHPVNNISPEMELPQNHGNNSEEPVSQETSKKDHQLPEGDEIEEDSGVAQTQVNRHTSESRFDMLLKELSKHENHKVLYEVLKVPIFNFMFEGQSLDVTMRKLNKTVDAA